MLYYKSIYIYITFAFFKFVYTDSPDTHSIDIWCLKWFALYCFKFTWAQV